MPASFLTAARRESFGHYAGSPSSEDLDRFFHLSDDDLTQIRACRGAHNRLGFALQLTTVRYLGTFLDDPLDVPPPVLQTLSRQLGMATMEVMSAYRERARRWDHVTQIRACYGYTDITERRVGFRLARWLYSLCWLGTVQPRVLFERAATWLLTHKILLPGCSTLERFVIRLRTRVEVRIWRILSRHLTPEQRRRLQDLLTIPEGAHTSWLDQIRSGPTRISGPALRSAINRLNSVRALGIQLPVAARVPQTRILALARFASRARAQAISRMPAHRRLATLVAFVHCLESTAQDDVLEVFEGVMQTLFGAAAHAARKARLRTLKDLDLAAAILAEACRLLLDPELPDLALREKVFEKIPKPRLEDALASVTALIQPPDHLYYHELSERFRSVQGYLPTLLKHVRFQAAPAGQPVVAAYEWLRAHLLHDSPASGAPREVINSAWRRYAVNPDDSIHLHAYILCTLDRLKAALHRRDVFVSPSWRYADPRANLLAGAEWEAMRPVVCRTLRLPTQPEPLLETLAKQLDEAYRTVVARLPDNPAVHFKTVNGKEELILSRLDELEEPLSLIQLRKVVAGMMPRVDLPEIVLEIAARTGFLAKFTHLTERTARVADLTTSLCAVLLAEACNTGPEPFIRYDNPALRRSRLAWVKQNYYRDECLTDANVVLVAAQNQLPLAHAWGDGECASADGMRFVVPIRTVHAGPNPKYFASMRGVTWYNLLSDQVTGLNAIPVPGTLRDSLILLTVVLEQQTELQPKQIMTDTGAYSDVVFGLFRLLGYRFSPRLADMGDARFWRFDRKADYGKLDWISRHVMNAKRIGTQWDDMLRLTASLLLGRVPATGIMRTLQVGDSPTSLANGIAELGRADKTLHMLRMLDNEEERRSNLTQLNRGEGRHSMARALFHGKRGELRQRYFEGQEDQLGALGLVLNMIVLWNTLYLQAALDQLQKEGYPIRPEDRKRLSPLGHDHIHFEGRFSLTVPEAVKRGELRQLRDPTQEPE